MWLGREYRDASTAQRIALAARDRGCVGCGITNNVCQPHHIIHWEHNGPTDIPNLCLLCGDCHQKQVHTNGAHIVQNPDGKYTLRHRPKPPPQGACTRAVVSAVDVFGVDAPQPPTRASDNRSGRGRATDDSPGNAGGTLNHPLRR